MNKLDDSAERDIYYRFKIGNPNSLAAIASDYDVSVSTVRRAIKRHRAKSAEQMRAKWKRMREQGLETL